MRKIEKLSALLESSSKRLSSSTALRLYYVDEAARLLVLESQTKDDFLQAYAKVRQGVLFSREQSASEIKGTSHALYLAEQTCLIAYLCKAVCEYSAKNGRILDVASFFEEQNAAPEQKSVAYVPSVISDQAYRIFADAISGTSAVYTSSFAQACENVYDGRVGYCILPYETGDEGTLSGFIKMMRKYELYPKYVCSVSSDRAVTKLALLGRSPCESPDAKTLGRYLRITLDSTDFYTFSRLSSACAATGLRLIKSESIPVSWDDDKYGSSLTFDITDVDAAPFLLYLMLEAPECSDKAIYYDLT